MLHDGDGYKVVNSRETPSKTFETIDESGTFKAMRNITSVLALAALLLVLSSLTSAQAPSGVPFLSGTLGNTTIAGNSTANTNPDADGKFEISSEGIRARFVPYGAAISNLFISDKTGTERDIVLGCVITISPHVLSDEGNKKLQVGQRKLLHD